MQASKEYVVSCISAKEQPNKNIKVALENLDTVSLDISTGGTVSTSQVCTDESNSGNLLGKSITTDTASVHMRGVETCIKKLKKLRSINLKGIGMSQSDLNVLLNSIVERFKLKAGSSLETLILSHNDNIGDECVISLCDLYLNYQSIGNELTTLELRRTNLTDRGFVALSSILQSCMKLERLDIGNNRLSENSCKALANGLIGRIDSPPLSLYLDKCEIGDDEIKKLVEGVIEKNSEVFIKYINLQENSISSDGIVCLSEALGYLRITNLNLKGNKISSKGVQSLANALKNSIHLKELDLSHQKVNLEKVALESICCCLNSENCGLVSLNLSGIEADDRSISTLARVLGGNSKLRSLLIESDSIVSNDAMKVLAKFLVANSTLVRLSLPKGCDEETRNSIQQVLILNEKLETIVKRQERRNQHFPQQHLNLEQKSYSTQQVSSIQPSSIVKEALEDLMHKTKNRLGNIQSPVHTKDDEGQNDQLLDERFERVETLLAQLLEKNQKRNKSIKEAIRHETRNMQRSMLVVQERNYKEIVELEKRIQNSIKDVENRFDHMVDVVQRKVPDLKGNVNIVSEKLKFAETQNEILRTVAMQVDNEISLLEEKLDKNQFNRTNTLDSQHETSQAHMKKELRRTIGRVFETACKAVDDSLSEEISKLEMTSTKTTSIIQRQLVSLKKRLDILEDNIISDRENTIRDLTILAQNAKQRGRES